MYGIVVIFEGSVTSSAGEKKVTDKREVPSRGRSDFELSRHRKSVKCPSEKGGGGKLSVRLHGNQL